MGIMTNELAIEMMEDSEDGDIQSAIFALEDGSYLATIHTTQKAVEDAWQALKDELVRVKAEAEAIIDTSIRENRIVKLSFSRSLAHELGARAEDKVKTEDEVEYWGQTRDHDWRVHLVQEVSD